MQTPAPRRIARATAALAAACALAVLPTTAFAAVDPTPSPTPEPTLSATTTATPEAEADADPTPGATDAPVATQTPTPSAAPSPAAGTVDLRVLTINDFHGRIEADQSSAGAAVLAGAVAQYRAENPNTLFVSAGDAIGASTFTSFINDDEPTIDALVAAGLDLGAVGNHEFDQGYADLVDRVVPRYGSGDFALGANVYRKGTTDPALAEYAIREVDGVRIGFIGTVTTETATIVNPDGIADLDFGDQLEAADRVAAEIADETDVIVLLAHSGSASAGCDALASEQSEYGELVREASSDIDAIVSGHTHQLVDCEVGGRPVVQAHEYGTTLGSLEIAVDAETHELVSIAGSTIDLVAESEEDGETVYTPLFPADPEVQAIVDAATEEADVLGQEVVGAISGDIVRGGDPSGSDRGVESTLGNLVADVYLWATTENADYGGAPADIAVMNPGGLRADLLYGEDGTLTYAAAAAVQPFGNTLTTTTLTGAQIEQLLEQQWQPGEERPKLHLGISEGFSYEYVDDAEPGEHIVSMTLDGEPLAADGTYLVTTNSFVSAGGDGFTAFVEGSGTADTGLIDLSATVDYFAAHDVVDPAPLGRAVATDGATPTPGPSQTPEQSADPESPAPSASPSEEAPAPAPSEEPTPAPEAQGPDDLTSSGVDIAVTSIYAAAVLIAAGALIVVARQKPTAGR